MTAMHWQDFLTLTYPFSHSLTMLFSGNKKFVQKTKEVLFCIFLNRRNIFAEKEHWF